MGRKMIKSIASSMLSPTLSAENGENPDESEVDGAELLETDTSLDYLCNLSPHRYEALYAKLIPDSMRGETFLEKYDNHNDPVTVVDHKHTYAVKAAARHPIYENFRVKIQQRNKGAIGYLPFVFEGSSPGAGKFGFLRIRRRIPPKQG
ncbi:hypothetical protein F0562_013615 [Nyssa sinensis]|uniref:Uncharacterized protein n=1 Tax=Nyssa sinensis TaxID=561372 RepID=A0A5J4ZN23_9ASTE|nr:hypothetical protein F0562_013615 [Nyssa sinensis]